MNNIYLLDCTLRDGGYINDWEFGEASICNIINKLVSSKVEYIECGYLSEKKGKDTDFTLYKDLNGVRRIIPKSKGKSSFAVMIDYGQYKIEHIPEAEVGAPIIRVCFHKTDMDAALDFCSDLMSKGYSVFVQPMASLNYTDVEFVNLIQKVNALSPACFYIVDSFGVIEIDDFRRVLFLTDRNLNDGIILGYHAHNNLQQAYGNAKYMVEQRLRHDIILDASVYGMGRGAGNLNMELFASFLNRNYDKIYNIDSFLDIMDEELKPIFIRQYWGYSLPFYLSARYNCHPNYAGYFADKNTLSNRSMKQLLASIPENVRISFSPEKAEYYYQQFQNSYIDDTYAIGKLKTQTQDSPILIIAPGKSIVTQKKEIAMLIQKEHPVIIAINILPADYKCNYIFCSNEKRINSIELVDGCQLIITSNIRMTDDKYSDGYILLNYSSYISEQSAQADNPTLMMMRILISMGIKSVYVAGFDGYSPNPDENYFKKGLSMGTSIAKKIERNKSVKAQLQDISKRLDIHFVTNSIYVGD